MNSEDGLYVAYGEAVVDHDTNSTSKRISMPLTIVDDARGTLSSVQSHW